MPYGNATIESREALAALGEGVIIEDPDFPDSETADVSVIIEGALDEEFAVALIVARKAAGVLFDVLNERYPNVSVEVVAYVGHEDDRERIFSAHREAIEEGGD